MGKPFVALIPKKTNSIYVTDFRPISLCNVCYEVISKMLANHLKSMIHTLFGPKQARLIPGRGVVDNIIAAQEIAHSLETKIGIPLG